MMAPLDTIHDPTGFLKYVDYLPAGPPGKFAHNLITPPLL